MAHVRLARAARRAGEEGLAAVALASGGVDGVGAGSYEQVTGLGIAMH